MYNVLFFVGGLLISIIGFFLRATMAEIKQVNSMAYETKSQMEVIKTDLLNKHDNLSEKIGELKEVIKDLLMEIKKLNEQ